MIKIFGIRTPIKAFPETFKSDIQTVRPGLSSAKQEGIYHEWQMCEGREEQVQIIPNPGLSRRHGEDARLSAWKLRRTGIPHSEQMDPNKNNSPVICCH